MTSAPDTVWNQIAQQAPLDTQAAKEAFKLNSDQIAVMSDLWTQSEIDAGIPQWAAIEIPKIFPMLTEEDALRVWMDIHPEMNWVRESIPEVRSPEHAAEMLGRQYAWPRERREEFEKLLRDQRVPILKRWLNCVRRARDFMTE